MCKISMVTCILLCYTKDVYTISVVNKPSCKQKHCTYKTNKYLVPECGRRVTPFHPPITTPPPPPTPCLRT